MPFKLFVAVIAAVLATWTRATLAQVTAGRVVQDMGSSAPKLTYTNACRGQFGVDYGRHQACFFEKPDYQGRCVCVGRHPTRRVRGAFRLETSEFGSVRIAPHLSVNIVLDDFKHEIKSMTRSCPQPEPVNYIIVARRDAVCAFSESNFMGRKFCLNSAWHMDYRFHQVPFDYQSVMVSPNTGSRVKAEVRRNRFVTRSAAVPMEIEGGGAPQGTGYINFSKLDDAVRANGPRKALRIAWNR